MPHSVNKDGVVRGPAPLGSSVVSLQQYAEKADEGRIARAASINEQGHPGSDCANSLTAAETELLEARRELSLACRSQQLNEIRLEKVSGNLLVGGEQIPALDQPSLTMMQEAYLNASTAVIVGADKITILEDQIERLQAELNSNSDQIKLLKAA